MNLQKRHLDLLRKRYRLPISLLTHETPPGSPLSEQGVTASSDTGTVTALVSCSKDVEGLAAVCKSKGCAKLRIQYADFISLGCVGFVKDTIAAIREDGDIAVVVENPWVAKEKMRFLNILYRVSSRLAAAYDTLHQEHDKPQQRERLQQMVSGFAMARDRAGKRTRAMLREKQRSLHHLILLELRSDASPRARAEGRWLLKHHKRGSYDFAHSGDKLSANLLELVRSQMEQTRGDDGGIPSLANLRKVRRNVLRSFGRYHVESKLQYVLEQACVSIGQYLQQEATRDDVCSILLSQRGFLGNLMNKRSLIGCRLINLDDPIGWEYDIDTENEESDAVSDEEGNDDSEADLMSDEDEDEDEDEGEGEDEGEEEEFLYYEEDESEDFSYGEEDDDNTSEDEDDGYSDEEANHAAHQVADIAPEEFAKVMLVRKKGEPEAVIISRIKDVKSDSIHSYDSPKGSKTIVEGPTEADLPEESPISASSFVSTNSEFADADVVQLLAKHGDMHVTDGFRVFHTVTVV